MKARLLSIIDRVFPLAADLPVGIFESKANPSNPTPYRIHLRIEPTGEGLLILNAKTVLHLNPTATEYAYSLVQNHDLSQIIRRMKGRYQIGRDKILKDYSDFSQRLETLITTPDLSPEIFLGFDRIDPHSTELTSPLRVDCALTYSVPQSSAIKTTPTERVSRELSIDEWKEILNKSWKAGIPHVIFTGGEPCMRPDLPELVAHAEALGMVSGLLTCGFRLSEKEFMGSLLNNGLDHIMLCLDPESEVGWEAIRDLMPADIFVTVHLTLTKKSKKSLFDVVNQLAEYGVKSISLSAEDSSLKEELGEMQNHVAKKGINLVWDLPVPYSSLNPVSLELERNEEQRSGAGKTWIYIEPDGDVLPEQGSTITVGNMLKDPWKVIKDKLVSI